MALCAWMHGSDIGSPVLVPVVASGTGTKQILKGTSSAVEIAEDDASPFMQKCDEVLFCGTPSFM